MEYVWFIWSLIILGIWLIIFLSIKSIRKKMLKISLWTMLLGVTEPLFIPEYWNPPSLFNLAQNTGFDIESFIFSFAIGGIGSVLYNLITKVEFQPLDKSEKLHRRHRFHKYIIAVPVALFFILAAFTKLNHIYCGVIALFVGAISALLCRPDLKNKIWKGGLLFTLLYFIYFTMLNLSYPTYVEQVWNMKEITGILILGIPIEEYLFAFAFGMFWSSLYEHIGWYKLVKPKFDL